MTASMQDGTFAEVASRANRRAVLAELISEFGGRLDARTHRGACILHGGERDSFAALDYGFMCHACGARGDVVHFVRLHLVGSLPIREGRVQALRWLAPRVGVALGEAPPAPRQSEPAGTEAARTLASLADDGAVAATAADVFAGIAAVYQELHTPDDWAALRELLLSSWLPAELERAGLWRRDALSLPAERPVRLRLKLDEAGEACGLYFVPLTGAVAA